MFKCFKKGDLLDKLRSQQEATLETISYLSMNILSRHGVELLVTCEVQDEYLNQLRAINKAISKIKNM